MFWECVCILILVPIALLINNGFLFCEKHYICINYAISQIRSPPGGGGGGGTLIVLYIRRLGSFFWVQIFEFQYLLGFSEK